MTMTTSEELEAFEKWNPFGLAVFKQAAWSTWQARAALANEAPIIPDGYKLVPIEPTQNMLNASVGVQYSLDDKTSKKNRGCNIYKAMLEAAPLPNEGKE